MELLACAISVAVSLMLIDCSIQTNQEVESTDHTKTRARPIAAQFRVLKKSLAQELAETNTTRSQPS